MHPTEKIRIAQEKKSSLPSGKTPDGSGKIHNL